MIDKANGLAQQGHKMNLFDGIDIDWEFPMGCGDQNHCDNSGFGAYKNMMQALRGVFPSPFLITSAITADASAGGKIDAADYAGGAQYLDKLFPMTYDFFGGFNAQGPTAPHSSLRDKNASDPAGTPNLPQAGFNTDAAIQKLKAKGVPASKMLLGIGFYGRGWTGVTQSAPGGAATGPAPGTYEAGIEDYKVLKNTCPVTGTAYGTAYAKCGNNWFGYDTPATIGGKMNWAKTQGLGGAFFWEFSGDTPNGELITAIKSNL
jgi:chitinase